MKSNFNHRTLLRIAILLFGTLTAAVAAPPVTEILREALYQEEVIRDPEKAAEHYTEVISQYDAQRAFAATALFRLAEVRKKQDRKDEAIQLNQRLILEFNDSAENLALAEKSLTALGADIPKPVSEPDEESKELAEIKKLEIDSPDLVDLDRLLARAAQKNMPRVARELIQKGANPNAVIPARKNPDSGESNPLADAAANGNLAMCDLLLNAGAKVEGVGEAKPLLEAAARGHLLICELLLNKGAEINFMPPPGLKRYDGTALIEAVVNGHALLAAKLIETGADVNAIKPVTNLTALHYAAQRKDWGMARRLVEAGARPDIAATIPEAEGEPARNLSDKTPIYSGSTALLMSVDSQSAELISLMVAKSQNPDLAALLRLAVDTGSLPVIEWLLANGADPNPDPRTSWPLLTLRGAVSNIDVTRLLLAAGANPNASRPPNTTPLRIVAQEEKETALPIAELLLKAGAKPDEAWLQHLAGNKKEEFPYVKCFEPLRTQLIEKFAFPILADRPAITLAIMTRQTIDSPELARKAETGQPKDLATLLMNPSISWPILSGEYWPEKIRLWRKDGDTVKEIWSGSISKDDAFPKLLWGDVVQLDFDAPEQARKNYSFHYHDGLKGPISWNIRRRISFPIRVEIDGEIQQFQMRGDRLAFDPTRREVPLSDAATLASLIWQDKVEGNAPTEIDVTVVRKGWPEIQIKSNAQGRTAFQLEPDDLIKRGPSQQTAAEDLEKRKKEIRIRSAVHPASKTFPAPAGETATITQVLADVLSAWNFGLWPEDETQAVAFYLERWYEIPVLWMNPDLSKLTVRRLKQDDTEEIIPIDLAQAIQKFSPDQSVEEIRKADFRLIAGDILEVPLLGDADGKWTGLSDQQESFFAAALRGRIQVTDSSGKVTMRETQFKALRFVETSAGKLPVRKKSAGQATSTMKIETVLGSGGQVTRLEAGGKIFLEDGDQVKQTGRIRVVAPSNR